MRLYDAFRRLTHLVMACQVTLFIVWIMQNLAAFSVVGVIS